MKKFIIIIALLLSSIFAAYAQNNGDEILDLQKESSTTTKEDRSIDATYIVTLNRINETITIENVCEPCYVFIVDSSEQIVYQEILYSAKIVPLPSVSGYYKIIIGNNNSRYFGYFSTY